MMLRLLPGLIVLIGLTFMALTCTKGAADKVLTEPTAARAGEAMAPAGAEQAYRQEESGDEAISLSTTPGAAEIAKKPADKRYAAPAEPEEEEVAAAPPPAPPRSARRRPARKTKKKARRVVRGSAARYDFEDEAEVAEDSIDAPKEMKAGAFAAGDTGGLGLEGTGSGGGSHHGYGRIQGILGSRVAPGRPSVAMGGSSRRANKKAKLEIGHVDLSVEGKPMAGEGLRDALDEDRLRREIITRDKEGRGYWGDGSRGPEGDLDQGVMLGNERARGKDSPDGRAILARLLHELEQEPPATTLPRFLYFENTYLGGDVAFRERLRRLDSDLGAPLRPYHLAAGYEQAFDPPPHAGMALSASLSRRWFDRPRRVILQVGLRGSDRYGWRRPPLDLALVVDVPVLRDGSETTARVTSELLRRLGPQDRMSVIVAGPSPSVLVGLDRIKSQRLPLARALETLRPPGAASHKALGRAMERAGEVLDAADTSARPPGTRIVLVLASAHDIGGVNVAAGAAHDLSVKGVVSSIIEVGASSSQGRWWELAAAGHGNYHRMQGNDAATPVGAELDSLSRVVARLLRVNIRLGAHTDAVRILGSRVLDPAEVKRVKAREVATDRNLSKTMGIKADRGDDDDGLQTVIPYFYGGDSHVLLVELWVKKPGAVADITLRYKDMVNLGNATARVQVSLPALPRPETGEPIAIFQNVVGFRIGKHLELAAWSVRKGDMSGALRQVGEARGLATATTEADLEMLRSFQSLISRGDWPRDASRKTLLADALEAAGRRKVGTTAR